MYILNTLSQSRIYFYTLAEDGAKVRGLANNLVIIDEAMLVDDDTYLSSIEPSTLATNGQIIAMLTPGTVKNYSYFLPQEIKTAPHVQNFLPQKTTKKAIQEQTPPYSWLYYDPATNRSAYEITIEENPFPVPEKRHEIMSKRHLPHIRREYFCEWVT